MNVWTLDADKRLVNMWETDKSASEIAIAMGRTACAIQQRARRLGLSGRKQSRPPADEKGAWTPEEDARVAELRRSGHKTNVIAVILGRTKAAVESRLRKPGLQKPKPTSVQVRKLRECMRCKTVILSDGFGHRLCEPCRRYAAYACGQYD